MELAPIPRYSGGS